MNLSTKRILFISSFFLLSCHSGNEDVRMFEQFLRSNASQFQNKQVVLVLTENGCPNCNRSFANFVKKQLSENGVICIVSSQGKYLDLSPFLDHPNVLFNFNDELKAGAIIHQTSALFINSNYQIDTLIGIQAKDLTATLDYLNNYIRN